MYIVVIQKLTRLTIKVANVGWDKTTYRRMRGELCIVEQMIQPRYKVSIDCVVTSPSSDVATATADSRMLGTCRVNSRTWVTVTGGATLTVVQVQAKCPDLEENNMGLIGNSTFLF